jgi:hypothetical protein
MKKLAATLCLAALTNCAFAQGTINFVNAAGPRVRYDLNNLGPGFPLTSYPILPPTAGTFYFALLTAPLGTTDPTAFNFAVYGTNLAAAGVIRGASSVNGWMPGTSRSFEVVGWDVATGGTTWNQSWFDASCPSCPYYLGVSAIGSGFAGGVDPVTGGPIPPLNIFGGNGIPTTSTFVLYYPNPEPGTAALAALGAAVLLTFRRRARVWTGLTGND